MLAAAAPAHAASATVSITDATFEPPVVVVPPGSTVTWRNDGNSTHAIVGTFCAGFALTRCGPEQSSPDLGPGAAYAHRFPESGLFQYRDRLNSNATGTILVALGGRRPPRARGNAQQRYRATISFAAREEFDFTDAGSPPCPAYIGNGTRTVQWTAKLPVTYRRFPRFGLELLAGRRTPPANRLGVLQESMEAKVLADENPCSYVDISCTNNLSGKPLRITLAWEPRGVLKNRFHVHNQRGHDIGWGESHCGSDAALLFAGLPDDVFSALPFAVGPFVRVPQDQATALATPAEVRRLRAGRRVRVVREFDLKWTDEAYNLFTNNPPRDNGSGALPAPGVGWPGNEQIFRFRAKLVITLVPGR